MLYDMHVHSKFSHDGKSSIDEYADFISEKNKYALGFTEHLDFMPECSGYGLFDYLSYIDAIGKYRSMGYHFFAGAELDYADKVKDEISEHLAGHEYDYTICSVHMLDGTSVSDGKNTEMLRDKEYFCGVIKRYYNEIFSSFKNISFDVLGHIGIYKRYLDASFYNEAIERLEKDLGGNLAEICAGSGRLIEINTSGLFAPMRKTLPDEGFLKHYREKGGTRVCIGSDAHLASNVFKGFRQAEEMLISLGFEYVYLPWDVERPVRLGL